MSITSLDILNLSHSLKDICEVNCKTSECLSHTLKVLLQYNLIQANLAFSQQFECPLHAPYQKHGVDGGHSVQQPAYPGGLEEKEDCVGLDIANPNRHDH